MADNKFDQNIKNLLNNHHVDIPKGSFDAFQKAEANYDAKEMFDQTIKEKLVDAEAAVSPSSWVGFEKILSADEVVVVDDMLKEKLAVNDVPYEDKTWGVLHNRLLEWEALRRHFWTMRISELCILFLLVFTLWNFIPEQPSDGLFEDITQKQNQSAQVLSNNASETKSQADRNTDILNNLGDDAALQNGLNLDQNPEVKIGDDVEVALNSKLVNNEKKSSSSMYEENKVSFGQTKKKAKGISTKTDLILMSSDNEVHELLIAADEKVGDQAIKNKNQIQNNSSSGLGKSQNATVDLYPSGLFTAQHFINEESLLINNPLEESRASSFLNDKSIVGARPIWISMNSQAGISKIYTPADEVNGFAATEDNTLSYGSGLSIGFVNRKWTLEAGVEFEIKTIFPNRDLNVVHPKGGNYNVDFRKINMHFINVGLQGRYNIFSTNKNQIYGLIGVKLHTASVDNYFVVRPGRGVFQIQDDVEAEDYFGVEQDVNYFTLNGGFGYQRYLSSRSMLFLQPSFEYYFQDEGVANNQEKVQTIRLDFGVRVKI